MSVSWNEVTLIGNLTRDPEVRSLQNGSSVCEIGLAVNEKYKDKSGAWVERCDFIDCSFFGRTAEVLGEYCSKGSSILVRGKLRLDTWEADGQKRSKLRVIGERMQMLGSRGGRSQSNEYSEPAGKTDWQAEGAKVADDSSIPF